MPDCDVLVVGAGNAALAAAVAAREQGAGRVVVLEKAPRELRGGNTHYSGGLLRFAFDAAEQLRPIVPDAERRLRGFMSGVEPYPAKLFLADLVTGGITFTFGGVRINDRAQVIGTSWSRIPGLYACGEMVGGLFHGNYPGGSGLMSGAVFGRIAGANAAGA